MRKTQIICTIEPASDTVDRLKELMQASRIYSSAARKKYLAGGLQSGIAVNLSGVQYI